MPERTIIIEARHPSLSGHFPGHPVVPAVVILGEIMEAVRQATARNIVFSALPNAKFLSPLAPAEELVIGFQQDAENSVTFTCRVGARLVAKGSLLYTTVVSIHGAENCS